MKSFLVTALSMVLFCAAAYGAPPTTRPVGQVAPPPANRASGNALLDQVLQAYKDTKTYQATVSASSTRKTDRVSETRAFDYKIALDRDHNRYLLDYPEFLTVCDGKKLYWQFKKYPGAHLELDAPAAITPESVFDIDGVKIVESHLTPDGFFLLSDKPVAALIESDVYKVKTLDPAADTHQPALEITDTEGNVWTLRIDPATKMIVRATFVLNTANAGGKAATDSFIADYQIKIEARNQPLAEKAFAFDPGKSKAVKRLQDLMAAGMGGGGEDSHPLVGAKAPEVDLKTPDGKPYKLSDDKTCVIVLDFWATWCAPCVEGLPKIQEVYDWAKKEGKSVTVYAVNQGDTIDEVRAFLKEKNLTLPVLMDPKDTVGDAYKVRAIPQTVVIFGGKVRYVHQGLPRDGDLAEILKKQIQELLDEQPTTQPSK